MIDVYDMERFIRIANAILKRRYPYCRQRRSIVAKMYSRWYARKTYLNIKEK